MANTVSVKTSKDISTPISSAAPVSLDEIEVTKLHAIARKLSNSRPEVKDGEAANPFFGSNSPELDPHSPFFNIQAWLQAVMGIASRDPERYHKGVAGVAYRDLSAHGNGEATDYQRTFGNCPLQLLRGARKLFGSSQEPRVQILRNFDGLVNRGELLLVLGRPGR
jgi:hypothetical protein